VADQSQRTAEWIHRTTLNTIRYLLTTSVIDRGALASFFAERPDDVYLPADLLALLDECSIAIDQVAGVGALDESARRRLTILDSRLRVRMQVDLQSGGAFVAWAMEIVEALAQRECVAYVTGIHGSADRRPIDAAVRSVIDALLVGADDTVSVRVLTDGAEDFLSLIFSSPITAEFIAAVRSTGLVLGESLTLADCILDLDFGPEVEDTVVTLVTSRPCQFIV
jgi:hypothetical protein